MNKLFTILIMSIIQVTILGSLLSFSTEVAISAFIFLLFILINLGSIAYLYQKVNDLSLSIIIYFVYVIIVVYIKSQFLIIPLIVLSAVFYYQYFRNFKMNSIFNRPVLFISFMITILILGSDRYSDFLIMEKLKYGLVHSDDIFHSSIASMIKNYSVISTGFNGLVETPYYILSHVLMACFSILTNSSVLEIYGFIPMMLLNILLIFSLAYVSMNLVNKKDDKSIYNIYFIIIIILNMIKFLPFEKFVLWTSYFVSESYTLSLILFLILFPKLIKDRLFQKDFLIIGIMIILISITKATVGLMLLGILGVRILFLDRNLILHYIILIVIFYYTVISMFTTHSGSIVLYPLDMIIVYSAMGDSIQSLVYNHIYEVKNILKALISLLLFFVVHFIFTWVAIYDNIKIKNQKINFSNLSLMYLISSFLASVLLISLFKIPDGSAYYFTNITMFIALPYVVSMLYYKFYYIINNIIYYNYKLILILILLMIISIKTILEHSYFNIYRHNNKKDDLVIKLMQINAKYQNKDNIILDSSLVNPSLFTKYMCTKKPFLYVAITEKPWKGILEKECNYKDYGYPQYINDNGTFKEVLPSNLKIIKK